MLYIDIYNPFTPTDKKHRVCGNCSIMFRQRMIYTQIYSVKESFGYTIGKTKCIYIVVVKNLLRVFSFGYIFFFFAVTLQESIFYVVYMFIFLLYFLRASTQEDFPQQRRPLQHDEHRSSLQRDGLSRPSGRYIYSMTKKKTISEENVKSPI